MPKPLKLGFKALSHAEKMTAKKAHRAKLAKLPRSAASQMRVAEMVDGMNRQNARNGVGRPPLFKRFLVSRETL